MKKSILVTGGLGYIGSHCSVVLIQAGYQVVIIDNLDNSSESILEGIYAITGVKPIRYNCDIRDRQGLEAIFSQNSFSSVIHFAAKKSVGESMDIPFDYYDNNIVGTKILLEVMDKYNVRNIIFSSTCAIYSSNEKAPYTEDTSLKPESVYGITKQICESMIEGLSITKKISAYILRYFNPIGNHESGIIGENPTQKAQNIMPVIMEVVEKKRDSLMVFGDTYDTRDGTCIRDYIHVMDLAEAHVKALDLLEKTTNTAGLYETINLGTGLGSTVLEIVQAVNEALDISIPYTIVDPRYGDLPVVYGNCDKAKDMLDWYAHRSISQAVTDMRNHKNKKK